MIAGVKALFVDTNILIYSTNPTAPLHQAAITVLQATYDQGIERTISTQILREFYGFATRPGEHGVMPPLAPVLASIHSFQRSFRILDDTQIVARRLFDDLVQQTQVGGRQIHDANIVATMLTYGITHVLTNNVAHFTRFAELITIVPLV